VRTLSDFETWTGVNAHWQIAHPRTQTWAQPPVALASDWPIAEKLLSERAIQVALPTLRTVDPRRAESVLVTISDATPREAFSRRMSPREYSTLRRRGLRESVRYKQGPLTLAVAAFLPSGPGKKFEQTLPD
jgi:hypothetical protein